MLTKSSLFVLSVAGIISSIIIIFLLASPRPSSQLKTSPIVQTGPGLPIRLKIPRINVDTIVEYVGLTSKGAIDVPKGPTDAAWFDLGPRPGESGSAVISGHYGWKNNIPAIFDNLNELIIGDKIYIVDEKGKTDTFIVRKLRSYGENENASDVFDSGDEKSHLNLITCKGVWNKTNKSYSGRLVVFSDNEKTS